MNEDEYDSDFEEKVEEVRATADGFDENVCMHDQKREIIPHDEHDPIRTDYSEIKDEKDKELIGIDIGCEVTAKVHRKLAEYFHKIEVTELRVKERNKTIKPSLLPPEVQLASRVYQMKNNNSSETQNTSIYLGNSTDNTKYLCHFTVPIAISCIARAGSDFSELSVVVLQEDFPVKTLPAIYRDGYAHFTTWLNIPCIFMVAVSPRKFHMTVSPSRTITKIEGCGLSLTFESKCVTSDEPISYRVDVPNSHNLQTNSSKLVLAASSRIYFTYDKSRFVKPIKLEASLHTIVPEIRKVADLKAIVIGFRNGLLIIDTNVRKVDEDVYTGISKGYDGACICICRRFQYENKAKINQLADELSVIYGDKVQCNILLFSHKRNTKSIVLSVSCCEVQDTKSAMLKTQEKGGNFICQTSKILLKPIQRLKIQIAGCTDYAGHGSHLWLLFLSNENKSEAYFTVHINRGLGKSPEGIITILTETNQRISNIEFYLDKVPFHEGKPAVTDKTTNDSQVKMESNKAENGSDLVNEHFTLTEEIRELRITKPAVIGSVIVSKDQTVDRYEQ